MRRGLSLPGAPRRQMRSPDTRKRPKEPVRSDCGLACTGRFDLREQGVRKLLAQTADRAPATAGTATDPLHSDFRGSRSAFQLRNSCELLDLPVDRYTVSVETAESVMISLAPPGKRTI